MAYERSPGDVVAWPKKPGAHEKAPDFSGDIIAHRDIRAGEKIRLSIWKKAGAKGTFLTGKVEDLRATDTSQAKRDVDSDSVPF